tara:strand:- start:633 stop:1151 length:519 start_codon:yes stop_codon:yes gene_type:complete
MSRPYTGNKDGEAKRLRAGMKTFIDRVIFLSDHALWNNGDFGVRNMRGKESLSVHACGRAVDFSYRKMGNKGKDKGRQHALQWCKILASNADALGVEIIIDYFPKPHGRAWKCDRHAWRKYSRPTVGGAPSGDWLHVELSPAMADNPSAVEAAFVKIFAAPAPAPAPSHCAT